MEYLSDNFRRFFKNVNVGVTTEQTAAREYAAVKALLEDPNGRASALSTQCFLQCSYRQETAIHDLNDVDVVALCKLWQPGSGSGGGGWTRDQIFSTLAAPFLADHRYRNKVRYSANSMCIKLELDIKVEILPAVFAAANSDPQTEPFRLYRPSKGEWDNGYARYHQQWLTWKNRNDITGGTFIPTIKVLKHIRTVFRIKVVSFHLESFLFRLPQETFVGAPAEYIPRILSTIAARSADDWYRAVVKTPCEDRDVFTAAEWTGADWNAFHQLIVDLAPVATMAQQATTQAGAVELWKIVLGKDHFPD